MKQAKNTVLELEELHGLFKLVHFSHLVMDFSLLAEWCSSACTTLVWMAVWS